MQPERADMNKDLGALSGFRASTEPSSTVSALSGFDPARMMMDELTKGIVNISETLDGTDIADTFWYRYWTGYLRGYEGLLDKLRAAIATEAHRAATVEDSTDG